MKNHYYIIKHSTSLEVTVYNFIADVVRKIHLMGHQKIRLSFPSYEDGKTPSLGDSVALWGEKEDLEAFQRKNWGFQEFSSEIQVYDEKSPSAPKMEFFSRHKAMRKFSEKKLKESWSEEQKAQKRARLEEQKKEDDKFKRTLPFLNITSSSTQQAFRLYVKKSSVSSETLDSYGLAQYR